MNHIEFRTLANYIYCVYSRIQNKQKTHNSLVIALKYWINEKPCFKNFDRLGFPWPDSEFHGFLMEYYLDNTSKNLRMMKTQFKLMKNGDMFKGELVENIFLQSKIEVMWSLYDMSPFQIYSLKISHDEFEYLPVHEEYQKIIAEDLKKIIYKHLDLISNKKNEQLS